MRRRIRAFGITGPSATWAAGLKYLRNVYFNRATGKYFKWAAHDDMIQPDFLRLCVDALEADDSLVVAHTFTRVIDEHGQFVQNYEWPSED